MKKRKKKATLPVLQTLDITLPQGWSELTSKQVTRVAYYLSLGVAETEFLVRLGLEFADLRPRGTRITEEGRIVYRYYHRQRGNVLLTAEQVSSIAEAMRWVTKEPEPMAAPILDGLPTPDAQLYGVTFEQFITADTACAAYVRTQNPDALRMMCAAFYPKSGRFDPEKVEAEARRIAYLPVWQLEAVVLWFIGAKKMLTRKYPALYAATGSEESPASGGEALLGLLSSLNEGRVIDNERIKATELHEVFYELNRRVRAAEKAESR